MRFNSSDHLSAWKQTNRFPKIHDKIYKFIIEQSNGSRFLDLGACHGLLTQRLNIEKFKWVAFGVEENNKYIEDGKLAGITAQILNLKITTDTLNVLVDYITKNKINTIVARRVLPEIWGNDINGGREFAKKIYDAGIKEIFIEGRIETKNAINKLCCINNEINLLSPIYKLEHKLGFIAKLT